MDTTDFLRATKTAHVGKEGPKGEISPESIPLYLTTAFNADDLDQLDNMYDTKSYTYIRTNNPNRRSLAELVSAMEEGEDSAICSTGMAAISTTLLTFLKSGDHLLSDQKLYGESIELFDCVLPRYGIETSFADFTDGKSVLDSIKPNTKMFYTETISNPMLTVVDIEKIAELAHANSAKLVVDNTFTTSLMIKPICKGADVSINSLTKFAGGHSDVAAGSITANRQIIDEFNKMQVLLGCTIDPFSAWLCQRSIRTMDLRVQKQMDNAIKLAESLAKNPFVESVYYPGLKDHPQHELAKKIFSNGYGGMLSFTMPDDRNKINSFMRKLKIAKYAMTLGGYKTTLSHPVSSSHKKVAPETREKMGISFGLMRVSVGIEDPEDLIADFKQALEVFAE